MQYYSSVVLIEVKHIENYVLLTFKFKFEIDKILIENV